VNVETIAGILENHAALDNWRECGCGEWRAWNSDGTPNGNFEEHVAEAVVAALGLTEETRTLADGMAGQTTNWKTGETTSHSRPCTRQSRLVTPWVGVGEQPQ
jgi:hypothetical protein